MTPALVYAASLTAVPPMTVIRKAIVDRLKASPVLQELVGAANIYRRPGHIPARLPAVTYFDWQDHGWIRMLTIGVQLDIWTKDADLGERIANVIVSLFDRQPLPVDEPVVTVEHVDVVRGRDAFAQSGEVAQRMVELEITAIRRL